MNMEIKINTTRNKLYRKIESESEVNDTEATEAGIQARKFERSLQAWQGKTVKTIPGLYTQCQCVKLCNVNT